MSRVFREIDRRRGSMAFITAVLLTGLLGMVACALDVGWIVMTRTQLQAAADSAALGAGTELLDGLGFLANKTSSEVEAAARPVGVQFAGLNRNGNAAGSYADANRDFRFGTANFDEATNTWIKTIGDTPYNMVEATLLRNQQGSSNGDQPLPMIFARILNYQETGLRARATAIILPANGFRIEPGSDETANLMPFAFREEIWRRHERAQDYYNLYPGVLSDPNLDQMLDLDGGPLFGGLDDDNEFVQLSFDEFTRSEDGTVSAGPDGILEINIYPKNLKLVDTEETSGNFGTVDFGNPNNSTPDIRRQIREGLNEYDLSFFDNNEITMSAEDPLDVNGDTGVSAGIKDALIDVIGDCKAIALFTNVGGPGNTAIFELVEFVGAAVMYVDFTGNPKELYMQRCKLVDGTAIGDDDDEIGENTTVFTSLILIE